MIAEPISIQDPLFRYFEREVNHGVKLLNDVRNDLEEVLAVCQGHKKQTNYMRVLISELAKGKFARFLRNARSRR